VAQLFINPGVQPPIPRAGLSQKRRALGRRQGQGPAQELSGALLREVFAHGLGPF
jgi:hypothetical protein